MALSEDQLQELVHRPAETLDIELKRWIDPAVDEWQGEDSKRVHGRAE